MNDVLSELRNDKGEISPDRIEEAIAIIDPHVRRMVQDVGGVTPNEMVLLLEQHVAGTNSYLAAIIMDLSNEMTEMWNFVGKIAGAKAHKPKRNEKDLEQIVLAMTFSRLMGLYSLLQSKGATTSGIVIPGQHTLPREEK